MKKCVVLGVTGGIAAYKSALLASMLKQADFDVQVAMTKNACEFVRPLTFETLTGNRVITEMFSPDKHWEVEHVELAKKAELFVIAPATANFIGKAAAGIADDFLLTSVMATKAKVIIAPAMNSGMYNNTIVQANILKLKKLGYIFVDPEEGRLACGDRGAGRLANIDEIFKSVCAALTRGDYEGRTVMITAGPTREAIDPVRYITNHSSGKMGYELARAAHLRGARVILISGPVNIAAPDGVEKIDVVTAAQMQQAVMDNFKEADVIIKAAAPSDFKPANQADQKIKRGGSMTVELDENADIAAMVGREKEDRKLVVFAAESQDLIENARKKLYSKNADLVVANDISQPGIGFDSDYNAATLIFREKPDQELGIMSKSEMANKILDAVLEQGK